MLFVVSVLTVISKGQFNHTPYAIFQCKPGTAVNEASNHTDLMAELKLLVQGQYFAESFANRANTYGVRIPRKVSIFLFTPLH